MIISTGMRTDIPAFFSNWFYNRIKEGFVMVRNPYNPSSVTKYILSPTVVDCINFCSKNPAPIIDRLDEIKDFRQIWHVTITPYGKDIEPHVPPKTDVIDSVKKLSEIVGKEKLFWRYDPIFISEKYSVEYHIRAFEKMSSLLGGYVNSCIISFIDLYEKTKRNFPEFKEVTPDERLTLGKAFAEIGQKYNIPIRSCCEGKDLTQFGINVTGCMTKDIVEDALGCHFVFPKNVVPVRKECNCIMGHDIGMYNSCPHECLYCYANYDNALVQKNFRLHNPASPFLIGESLPGDVVRNAEQSSFLDKQMRLF